MILPLPNEIKKHIKNDTPNLSLKYYKWLYVYKADFSGLSDNKKEYFEQFIELSIKEDYKKAHQLKEEQLEGIGITFTLTTASRLITGIGYTHPTEIGFMFDWTSGLPVIPGSSLKGVALNVVENEPSCCLDEEKLMIFGSKESGGEIIFFPAYPCSQDRQKFLELDVMTPHYGPYYRDPQNNPPADWYSPVPLHFLTVPEGIRFCFRLAHRRNLKDKESPLLTKAKNILTYTLTEYGVGAKTNVFYGYFK